MGVVIGICVKYPGGRPWHASKIKGTGTCRLLILHACTVLPKPKARGSFNNKEQGQGWGHARVESASVINSFVINKCGTQDISGAYHVSCWAKILRHPKIDAGALEGPYAFVPDFR